MFELKYLIRTMTKSWLLGHDLSEHSNQAAHLAAKELEWQSGTLMLLHAYQVPVTPLSFSGIHLETSYMHEAQLSEVLEKNSIEALDKIAADLKKQFPKVTFQTWVKTGEASDVILEMAELHQVERIIVGSHCRKGLERWFVGSVAERVVRGSHASVLVVKHEEY